MTDRPQEQTDAGPKAGGDPSLDGSTLPAGGMVSSRVVGTQAQHALVSAGLAIGMLAIDWLLGWHQWSLFCVFALAVLWLIHRLAAVSLTRDESWALQRAEHIHRRSYDRLTMEAMAERHGVSRNGARRRMRSEKMSSQKVAK
ncbi:MAG: hypothetical protein ACFCUN_06705 [Hyphomicrobiaceae bacterium]